MKKPRYQPKKKLVEIDDYSSPLIQHALIQRLKEVNAEIEILKLTHERELAKEERWMLQSNLQLLPREELKYQLNAWISLQSQIRYWIEQFNVEKSETEANILLSVVASNLDANAKDKLFVSTETLRKTGNLDKILEAAIANVTDFIMKQIET